MGTWDLGTRDEGLETSSMGRGDAGTSNTGTRGTRDVNDYYKSQEVNAMSLCYLWSTLDSIFQNHIGHLMMLTQNISL